MAVIEITPDELELPKVRQINESELAPQDPQFAQALGLDIQQQEGISPQPLEPGAELERFSARIPETPSAPLAGEPQGTIRAGPVPVDPSGLGAMVDRSVFVGAGGTAGALAGAALGVAGGPGGAIRGSAIGGALGAAGGSAIFDNVDQFLRSMKFFTAPTEGAPLGGAGKIAKRAIDEGLTDLAFSLGFAGVGRIGKTVLPTVLKGGRSLMGRLLGVADQESARILAVAQDLGVPLSAFDVSKFSQGFAKVLGVFPYIGTPIRQEVAKRAGSVQKAAETILNEVAPNTLIADLGGNLVAAASKKFVKFRKTAAKFYDEFRSRAASASIPDIFESKAIVEAAKSIDQEIAQEATKTVKGVAGQTAPAALRGLLARWGALPERMTIQQVRGLKREARRVLALTKDKTSRKRLITLVKAADTSIQSPRVDLLPEGEAKAIVDALESANSFYSREIPKFQSPTAKKMILTDKRLFSPGAKEAGTKTEDELARVFRNPTPDQVKELRALVSPKVMKRYARTLVQNAYEGAFKAGGEGGAKIFDPFAFERQLGLTGADRLKREGLAKVLKGTVVGLDDLERFIDIAKRATAFSAPEASSFVARRLILGGGLMGGLVAGSSAFGETELGLAGVGLLMLGGRRMARIISDPNKLRSMTTLLDRSKPISVRREALKRVARGAAAPEPVTDVPFFNFVGP